MQIIFCNLKASNKSMGGLDFLLQFLVCVLHGWPQPVLLTLLRLISNRPYKMLAEVQGVDLHARSPFMRSMYVYCT